MAGGLILASAPLAASPAKLLHESLTDLGKFGDRIGASLALEFGLDPSDRVSAYLARFDTGSLGVNYDPANLFLSGPTHQPGDSHNIRPCREIRLPECAHGYWNIYRRSHQHWHNRLAQFDRLGEFPLAPFCPK